MSKRTVTLIVILTILVGGAIAFPKFMLFWQGRMRTINTSETVILIRESFTAVELADFLIEKKLINDKAAFLKIAANNNLNKSTVAKGKYIILQGETYSQLVEGFIKTENGHGKDEVMVNVIFTPTRDIKTMAKEVEKCLLLDSAKLVQYLSNPETLNKFGFTPEQLPALFFPGHYKMYFDTDEVQFVDAMAAEFKTFWTPERKRALQKIGLTTQSQAATLASIVYSEQSRHSDEWPTIAALYLNRLKINKKLQSDPTFKFCWEGKLDGVNRLLGKHREIDCAYNTYKYAGLPPGPICLVPKEVVEAVLNPDKVNYLYMCAKPDYSFRHNFEFSDVEHVKNASAYQKWLTEEKEKRQAR